ncbi:conserved hypothetical protein [Talaromyces stipitatus ATCC 10500]|uniref:Cupin type-2 domain-containing protein n=1 Tax=Talaromyces stipitatus (strain ATCC 10500 / CBS 375.48 / QM 6759 / NRRL 1006) TaxID=441959 RepID=B8M1Q4_TALSN|nr:uncharacterized protein TSTA_093870 [Talaromyces stipitatus ATCC 10500]EED22141.1 conserved hypothetical protein [Talaromyces stipitatus ATCC 10500]
MVPTPFDCDFGFLYQTYEFPADLNGEWEDPILQPQRSLSNENGVVVRVVDFPPKTKTRFHRTVSLDFGIIFEGEMSCYLDNGVELTMRRGDVCVQRGTMHGWENKSDKPARIYFVLTGKYFLVAIVTNMLIIYVAAKPVSLGGKLLTNAGFNAKDEAKLAEK